jgi:protein TonB
LASTALSPEQDPSDRLGVALFLALVFHAAVILGVSFAPRERPREQANTLDIVLVQSRTDEIPEETDFLGQANQIGGGESEEVARPATPLPAPLRSQRAEIVAAARPSRPSAPLAIEQRVTAAPEPRPEDSAPRRPAARPLLSQTRTPTRHRVVSTPTPSPTPKSKPAPKPDPMVRPETPPKPPASTREHAYASYMEAWRMKVERIGNLNYPDEARRKRLSGHLLLDVALNPDGSIHDIVLRRSSGHKVLDDAAVRIVKLASPYARFPQNIAQEVDVLHIQRTWRFSSTNRFLGD